MRHVVKWPDGASVGIIAQRRGYIVRSSSEYIPIGVEPIIHVLVTPSGDMVILGDFVRFEAYSRSGPSWRSAAMSWDGFKSLEVTDDAITGLSWDAPGNRWVAFALNLSTGEHIGGAAPPLP